MAVELPKTAVGAAFSLPGPLPTLLVDLELPLSLAALWEAAFSASSELLADFHALVADFDIVYGPWLQKGALLCITASQPLPLWRGSGGAVHAVCRG